jgi:uncharacterized protein YfeS
MPRLEAIVLAMSYRSWGGGYPVSMIGPLLEDACSSGECGLDTLYVTVCFPSWGLGEPPFEGPSPFANQYLGLPKVRWERGRRRLSVRYESQAEPLHELAGGHPPSVSALRQIIRELAAVIRNVQRRLLKSGLDPAPLLAAIESLPPRVPETGLEEWSRRIWEKQAEERLRLPWWEALGVDWRDYHPSARELLDDPLFWSKSDDLSPHGNDTGGDLLPQFRAWRRRHRAEDPIDFLPLILRRFECEPEWRCRPLSAWDTAVEQDIVTHDQAVLALAFGVIKLEGSCPSSVRQAALDAIARQLDPRVHEVFGWTVPPEFRAALEKMRAVLERIGAS